MREIPLPHGVVAVVDDRDYVRVSAYRWHYYLDRQGNARVVRGKHPQIAMSRFLLDLSIGDPRRADHKNGDTLDHRRVNLRICTHAQNVRNRHARTAHFKGVAFDPAHAKLGPRKRLKYAGVISAKRIETKPWRAHICVNYKNIQLGRFASAEEAARAYDAAAIQHHGEFANLNFRSQ